MRPEIARLVAKARASQRAAILLQSQSYLNSCSGETRSFWDAVSPQNPKFQQNMSIDFAASRAYYAMFYAAQALLLERGLSFSSHSAVIAAFGREFAKTAVISPKLHRYLLDAQDMRNLGDYGIGPSITQGQLTHILANTDEFLSEIERALPT